MEKIELYASGARDETKSALSAMLIAYHLDGRTYTKKMIIRRDGLTKNQADIMALGYALKCIKPEHRNAKIIAHTASPYLTRMIEKNMKKVWAAQPKLNVAEVTDVRAMIDKYPNIEFKRTSTFNKVFEECVQNAETIMV